MKDEIKNISEINDVLFQTRRTAAMNVKTPDFEMHELDTILKSLVLGKIRDPEYLVTDIFKEGVIGTDLKVSILVM